MTNYQSPKMTFDTMFKLALLALFAFIAYLLNGYSNNGRYVGQSDGHDLLITDTRTGETLVQFRYGYEMGRGDIKLFDYQKELQSQRTKGSETDENPDSANTTEVKNPFED